MHKVQLTYFRTTGKYYTEGEFETSAQHLWHIWAEVDRMRLEKTLPGLIKGHSPFIVLVEVPNHEHDHPILLGLPVEDEPHD